MTHRIIYLRRNRHLALTAAAAALGLVGAIYLVGAPPVAAIVGVAAAAGWLFWRAPRA